MKDLDDMPMSLVMDMLEATASKHGLKFDLKLINFADDIWAQAQAHALKVKRTDERMKSLAKAKDDSDAWLKWVDANSYGMKTLKGQSK
jgi:hypothetical protein